MAPLSKLNTVPIANIVKVDTVNKNDIIKINTIDITPGFSTDYSLSLNGSNQYSNLGTLTNSVIQPTQVSMNTTGYTMACWIYLDAISGGEYIFNIGQSGTNNYHGLKFLVSGGAAVVGHVFGLNGSTPGAGSNNRRTLRTGNNVISTGTWYHLAWVIEAGSMEPVIDTSKWGLFINGVKQTSVSGSGNINTNLIYTGTTSLGAQTRTSAQNFLDGLLNNQSIWNDELSDAAIVSIYNSGTPLDLSVNTASYTNSSNLIAWWRYNEGTGTSYSDSSSNSFTGSGVNSPTWSTNTP